MHILVTMKHYLFIIICSIFIVSCSNQKPELPKEASSLSGFLKVDLDTVFQNMDTRVQETSGLMRIGETIWTNNDSGGEPNIYQVDMTTGKVIRTVTLKGVKNVDWEELTSDSTHFYIGNFGNNLGKRKDLEIYKGKISDLLNGDEVEVETIKFKYADQTKYYNGYNHNHDCEAMVVYDNEIVLFSKNWGNMRCKMYTIPNEPGEYTIEKLGEFDSQGVITAADISPSGDKLILLGYSGSPQKGFDPFIWKLTDWKDQPLITGAKLRVDFHVRRQMEGVVFEDDRTLLISSEDESTGWPSLYRMHL